MKPVIKPSDSASSHRTGSLIHVDRKLITKLLGFAPNVEDDPDKVTASWAFTVDGVECAVWDYKGSFKYKRASTFGPIEALEKVFGRHVAA
jgi:hypothetical protein